MIFIKYEFFKGQKIQDKSNENYDIEIKFLAFFGGTLIF
jgi:hypothetical protein